MRRCVQMERGERDEHRWTHETHRRRYRPAPVVLLSPLLLLALLSPDSSSSPSSYTSPLLFASAQYSHAVHSYATSPDFSSFRTLFPLLFLLLSFPFLLFGSILLWKRRFHYPIAGRGSTSLLLLNFLFLISIPSQACISIFYPQGIPCGVWYICLYGFIVPMAFLYVFRGWILVCRLEIRNYLAERQWREEQVEALEKYADDAREEREEEEQAAEMERKEKEQKEAKNKNKNQGIASAIQVISPTPAALLIQPAAATTAGAASKKLSPEEAMKRANDVCLDNEQIPGHRFISNRQYTESHFLNRCAGGASVVILLIMILVGVFDPDVQLSNSYFHSNDLLPEDESVGSQFSGDQFLNSAPCLAYSIKMLVFIFLFCVSFMPIMCWLAWRLHVDNGRQAKRKKEKEELEKLLHTTEEEEEKKHQVHQAAPVQHIGLELDDSINVKHELTLTAVVCVSGIIVWYATEIWAPEWMFVLAEPTHFFAMQLISIIMPLRLSYVISAKHREMILSDSANGNKNKGENKTGNTYSQVSRHRPYYTLKFILHNSTTYPVLLSFLRKEYSSENVLFWSECREYERACKILERSLPTWPKPVRLEFDMTTAQKSHLHHHHHHHNHNQHQHGDAAAAETNQTPATATTVEGQTKQPQRTRIESGAAAAAATNGLANAAATTATTTTTGTASNNVLPPLRASPSFSPDSGATVLTIQNSQLSIMDVASTTSCASNKQFLSPSLAPQSVLSPSLAQSILSPSIAPQLLISPSLGAQDVPRARLLKTSGHSDIVEEEKGRLFPLEEVISSTSPPPPCLSTSPAPMGGAALSRSGSDSSLSNSSCSSAPPRDRVLQMHLSSGASDPLSALRLHSPGPNTYNEGFDFPNTPPPQQYEINIDTPGASNETKFTLPPVQVSSGNNSSNNNNNNTTNTNNSTTPIPHTTHTTTSSVVSSAHHHRHISLGVDSMLRPLDRGLSLPLPSGSVSIVIGLGGGSSVEDSGCEGSNVHGTHLSIRHATSTAQKEAEQQLKQDLHSAQLDHAAHSSLNVPFGAHDSSPTHHSSHSSHPSANGSGNLKASYKEEHQEAARLREWALKIFHEYVARSCLYEINISEDLHKQAATQAALLAAYSPTPHANTPGNGELPLYSNPPIPPPFPLSTIYKAAQLEVFELIQRDSFRRFVLTEPFRLLLAQADEEELARREKQVDLTADVAALVDRAGAKFDEQRRPSAQSSAANGTANTNGANGTAPPRRSKRGGVVSGVAAAVASRLSRAGAVSALEVSRGNAPQGQGRASRLNGSKVHPITIVTTAAVQVQQTQMMGPTPSDAHTPLQLTSEGDRLDFPRFPNRSSVSTSKHTGTGTGTGLAHSQLFLRSEGGTPAFGSMQLPPAPLREREAQKSTGTGQWVASAEGNEGGGSGGGTETPAERRMSEIEPLPAQAASAQMSAAANKYRAMEN